MECSCVNQKSKVLADETAIPPFLSFISYSLVGKYSRAVIDKFEWDLFHLTSAAKFSPSQWMWIESSLEIPVL